MARFLAQIIITGSQIIGRAFARAIKQEIEASQDAARRMGNTKTRAERIANTRLGLSVDEAKQILNVSNLNKEEIDKRYDLLLKMNERNKGGSFYIVSKIVRAKERLDHELKANENEEKQTESASSSSKT